MRVNIICVAYYLILIRSCCMLIAMPMGIFATFRFQRRVNVASQWPKGTPRKAIVTQILAFPGFPIRSLSLFADVSEFHAVIPRIGQPAFKITSTSHGGTLVPFERCKSAVFKSLLHREYVSKYKADCATMIGLEMHANGLSSSNIAHLGMAMAEMETGMAMQRARETEVAMAMAMAMAMQTEMAMAMAMQRETEMAMAMAMAMQRETEMDLE